MEDIKNLVENIIDYYKHREQQLLKMRQYNNKVMKLYKNFKESII